MFERFTEGARRVVFFARYEASNLGSPTINTEHLLLGILREDKALVRQVLPDIEYESVRQALPENSEQRIGLHVDLPLSEHAKEALKSAMDEADHQRAQHIGTEHLLLALTLDNEFGSAKELSKVVNLELLRKRIEALPVRGPLKSVTQPRPIRHATVIQIHGRVRMQDAVAAAVQKLKEHPFYWERKLWQARDVVYEKNGKRFSFDTTLAQDADKFLLVQGGWKKDHCVVCGWELFESEDPAHGTAFTNGMVWVCEECYRRFVETDYFSSSYSDLT